MHAAGNSSSSLLGLPIWAVVVVAVAAAVLLVLLAVLVRRRMQVAAAVGVAQCDCILHHSFKIHHSANSRRQFKWHPPTTPVAWAFSIAASASSDLFVVDH